MLSEVDVMVFEQAVRSGKARTVAAHEAALVRQAQADAERAEEIRAAWAPYLVMMRAAMPGWAHAYLTAPADEEPTWIDAEYEKRWRPAVWRMEGTPGHVTPILVWVSSKDVEQAVVVFEAARWTIVDSETELGDVVMARRRESGPLHSWRFKEGQAVAPVGNFAGFEVALAAAVDEGARYEELAAEAARRNAARARVDEGATVAAEAVKVTATDWLALAGAAWQEVEEASRRLGECDGEAHAASWRRVREWQLARAQVLALVGIGTELRELGETVAAASAAARWG